MVRHIVMWNFKPGFTEEQNAENAMEIKRGLEGLSTLVDGMVSLKVEIEPLRSSNRDIMLNSLFESDEALVEYQAHPEHVRVSEFIASVTENRACVDYYEYE